jgi:hypothetical protein
MTELPIACTLTHDGMTARLELIDALAADGLLDRTPTDTGLRVRLRDTPEIERRTRDLIAAESKCCAFLDFDLGRDGDWRDPVRSVRSLGESYRPCVGKEDNRSDGIVETPAAFAGADHQEVA